jgi:hypothetical protein
MSIARSASPRAARPNFRAVSDAALMKLSALVVRWLPEGRRQGNEWIARNPTRADNRPGSFKINIRTGRWADFATGAKGGDVISLAAHLHGLSQSDAARQIGAMLGISPEDTR